MQLMQRIEEKDRVISDRDKKIIELQRSLILANSKLDSYHSRILNLNQKILNQAQMLANLSIDDLRSSTCSDIVGLRKFILFHYKKDCDDFYEFSFSITLPQIYKQLAMRREWFS